MTDREPYRNINLAQYFKYVNWNIIMWLIYIYRVCWGKLGIGKIGHKSGKVGTPDFCEKITDICEGKVSTTKKVTHISWNKVEILWMDLVSQVLPSWQNTISRIKEIDVWKSTFYIIYFSSDKYKQPWSRYRDGP